MFGALVSAGAHIAGGLLGKSSASRSARDQAQFNHDVLHSAVQDREMQREFAQHGIRWKVEDAKAAGLHPLFALGGVPQSYSPVTSLSPGGAPQYGNDMGEALSRAGQDIGRAISAQETPEQRQIRQANLALVQSQIERNHSEAMAARSQAVRNAQAGTGPGPAVGQGSPLGDPNIVKVNPVDPLGQFRGLEGVPMAWDTAKFDADPMTSRSSAFPGQTAGRGHAAWREFEMANGDKVYLPASGNGGVPEEIDIAMLPEIVGANIRRYGASQAIIGTMMRWLGMKYEHGMFTNKGYRPWMPKKKHAE